MKEKYKFMEPRVKRIVEQMEDSYYTPLEDLSCTVFVTKEPVPFEARESGNRLELKTGDSWGDLFDCGWFHFTGTVPQKAKGCEVVLLIDVNGEGLVVDELGQPVLGLTTGTKVYKYHSSQKKVLDVTKKAEGGEKIDIWMEAGCNDLFGKHLNNGSLKVASIAVFDSELESLYYDAEVLLDAMNHMDKNSPRYYAILNTLNRAVNAYIEDKSNVVRVREILKRELDKKGGDPSLCFSAIGHAHIDLAWLWPVRETIRKGGRTFSTVLSLMDKYPDYKFGASQPQLYQWMKDFYPSLFEGIKEKVAQGRWELQGGMWVEADTNLSGGEALVRQLLYGNRFYEKEFGKRVTNLWLPDVFGYTGALPQILKKSGIDYFLTTKLSWSEFNEFPYHTFIWQGIDGSSVLCHLPPEGTYNSPASPHSLVKASNKFHEKGISDEAMILYGIGDGGGGPSVHHQERLNRLKNFEGLPPVRQEFAEDFFDRINQESDVFSKWQGELYLEYHRGTYTSQARNKKYNRKLELLLREAEFASVLAMSYADYDYPQDLLETIWKEVLLYQFHDILPGSSIKRVYDESIERYGVLEAEVQGLIQLAYRALQKGKNGTAGVINSLGWTRRGWVRTDHGWASYNALPFSIGVLTNETFEGESLKYEDDYIENACLKVVFDETGAIISVFDKVNNRETLEKGSRANVLNVYEDLQDAWDFDMYYDQSAPVPFRLVSSKKYIDGPKVVNEQVYAYNKSTLKQQVYLSVDDDLLVFETQVNWDEAHKMLRTSFPIDVYTDEAVCEIQFGTIKRPTHRNTSWDMAKYEVCAHRWVDMSEADYGVSLLNDCKYGHKLFENTIDLNLLRSTQHPGIDGDKGEHTFKYALYPHLGDHIAAQTVRRGYEFNVEPVLVDKPLHEMMEDSFISVDRANVIIDTIKKMEDTDDIILRLYESVGVRTEAVVKLPKEIKAVTLTDMSEYDIEGLAHEGDRVTVVFKPFEIATLRLTLTENQER